MNDGCIKALIVACFFVLISIFPLLAQERIPVFISGEEGHKTYRIPAIIDLPGGDLLAFCEGRVHSASDFGDVNIVMKRSGDQGKTWGVLQTLVDYDTLQAGNPAPVVDKTDPAFPGGRIFLFYNTGNNHEHEVRRGNGVREVWYITSVDGGHSWSPPVNITVQVHRPLQPGVNAAYNFKEDWRHYANTPGHAMQFTSGKYKGRIYVAANHSFGNLAGDGSDYRAHAFYSDDHGKTFQLSEDIHIPGSNEALAAEISNNGLMMNIRNQKGDVKQRIIAKSKDGGARWDTVYFDKRLPDPVCQGSIVSYPVKKGKYIVAVSNAADTVQRNNLTLRISRNEGKTWYRSVLVESVTSKDRNSDPAAYSDLVVLSPGSIGVLYEYNEYSQIVFKVVREL
ncbi:MAG: exo-alpha-sialidase [Chitinophagaceae bacterium]|nr:exo-alpha-sialidase [Chitinophagaceae bacterium]